MLPPLHWCHAASCVVCSSSEHLAASRWTFPLKLIFNAVRGPNNHEADQGRGGITVPLPKVWLMFVKCFLFSCRRRVTRTRSHTLISGSQHFPLDAAHFYPWINQFNRLAAAVDTLLQGVCVCVFVCGLTPLTCWVSICSAVWECFFPLPASLLLPLFFFALKSWCNC